MAKVNLSKAAVLVGKNRTTIWRHVKQGRVSIERDRDGNPLVDTSELIRVYGELKPIATPEKEKKQHHASPTYSDLINTINELRKEQTEMKKQLENITNRLTFTGYSEEKEEAKPSYEADPLWPKEIKSIADITLRNELKEKHSK